MTRIEGSSRLGGPASDAASPAEHEAMGSLLVTPSGPPLDAMSTLYLLEAKDQALEIARGSGDVKADEKTRKKASEEMHEALRREAEAAQHHGFWSDLGDDLATIGKVAAVVGSVAVAVASAGAGTGIAALAIAGATMSTAAFAEGEAHVLEKLGVDAKTSAWIEAGLSIGGAVTTGGAGTLASAAEGAARTTAQVAQDVSATSRAAGGAATIEAGHYQAEAERRAADAETAKNSADDAGRAITTTLGRLRDGQDAEQRCLADIRGTMEIEAATMAAAVRA